MKNKKQKINFRFVKAKDSRWFNSSIKYYIKYKNSQIGWLEHTDDGFIVVFIGDASKEQMIENPNCSWAWKRFKRVFANVEEAQKYIKDNQEGFFSLLYTGIQDGTFFQI